MLSRTIRALRSSIASRDAAHPGHTRWQLNLVGQKLSILDIKGSKTCPAVFREIVRNELGLLDVRLQPGDTVIDIGANVGIPSLYLAKKFPQAKFYLFEPVPENYQNLLRNIEANQVRNVVAQRIAITADGRDYPMNVVLHKNSGGGTGQVANLVDDPSFAGYRHAPSLTLDQVFAQHRIPRCALLKIDCEGAEHEILHAFQRWDQVDRLIAEAHLNQHLESQGYSFARLREALAPLAPHRYQIKCIRMSE